MNALTVNGKQLFAASEIQVELVYYPETLANNWAIFPGDGITIYAGEYEFRVNVPDAAYVYGRNVPGMDPTPIPIVNGVAKWTNPEDFTVWNTSIYFLCLLPEDYTTVYPIPDDLDVTLTPDNFKLIKTDVPLQILGYEEGPTLLYLTYFTDAENNVDVPVVNTLGSTWNLSTAVQSRNNAISVNGAMPASYSAKTYANLGNALTDILPVTNLRKFTVGFWAKSNTSGAVQFLMTRYHAAFSNMWIYALDATSLLNFNFNLSASNCEVYNGATSSQTGEANPNIGSKTTWNYWSMYVDRDDNYIEFYVNGTLVYKIFNKENLVGGTQDIDTIMRFYPDASYYQGYHITELAIWNGKYTDMPTAPLR